MPKIAFPEIVGIAGIVLTFVLIVLDKAGKLKGHWLFILLGLAAVMTLFIAIGNSWVMDAPERWRLWRGALTLCVVVLTYSGIAIWIYPILPPTRETAKHEGVDATVGSGSVVTSKSDAANPLPIDIRYHPTAYRDGTVGNGLVWKSNMVDLKLSLTNPTERDYENLDLTIATDLLMAAAVQTSGISKVELAPQARPPRKLTTLYVSMTGADGRPMTLTPKPGISYADEYRLRCDKFARSSTVGLVFQIVKAPDSPWTIPDKALVKGTYRVGGSQYHVDIEKSFNAPKRGSDGRAHDVSIRGSDNTVVGAPRYIEGNGNTIVGPTDDHGNTIINKGGTAIGNGATADSTSIAIGAHANAGGESVKPAEKREGKVKPPE